MRLYFVRHAEASYDALSDHERALTKRGMKRTEAAAQVMANLNLRPSVLYSSPRVRALQTAEIIGKALEMKVTIDDGVNFGFDVKSVKNLIRPYNEDDEIMFVGHNPSISEVVAHLSGANVSMKKGGLARIDLYSPTSARGELVWLIAPKVFNSLADDSS